MSADAAPEYDVVLRLVVTRRVRGDVTRERRHRVVHALRSLLSLVGPRRSTYRVDVCEVAAVRPAGPYPPNRWRQ